MNSISRSLDISNTQFGQSRAHIGLPTMGYQVDQKADVIRYHAGLDECYAITRQRPDGVLEIHAYTTRDAASPVSSVYIGPGTERFEGQQEVWRSLPRAYLWRSGVQPAQAESRIAVISSVRRQVQLCQLPPAPAGNRVVLDDIIDSLEGPLLCVGREGDLSFIDPVAWQTIAKSIPPDEKRLVRRGAYRRTSREFWVADETSVVIFGKRMFGKWKSFNELRIRYDDGDPTWYCPERVLFSTDESCCAILRPRLNEAVIVDCSTFAVTGKIAIDAAAMGTARLLPGGRLVESDLPMPSSLQQ